MSNEIATIPQTLATDGTLVTRVAKKAAKDGTVKQTSLSALDLLIDGSRDERDCGALALVDKALASNNFAFVMRSIERIVPIKNLMASSKHTHEDYLFTARGEVMGGVGNTFSRVDTERWDMVSAMLYSRAALRWLSEIDKCAGKKAYARNMAAKVIAAVKAKEEAKKAALTAA